MVVALALVLLSVYISTVMAQSPEAAKTGNAQIQQVQGEIYLDQDTTSALKAKQVLNDGDAINFTNDSLITILYNSGCSEQVSGISSHSISACGCQTSPFRVGKVDDYNATITSVTGEILVFQENKYVPASSGMRIRNGDRIMSMRNASATITFDHGCIQTTDAFSIQDVNGCNACPVTQTFEQPPQPQQPVQQAQQAQTSPASATQSSSTAGGTTPSTASAPGSGTTGTAAGTGGTGTGTAGTGVSGTGAGVSGTGAGVSGTGAGVGGTGAGAAAGASGTTAAVGTTGGLLANPGFQAALGTLGVLEIGDELGLDDILTEIGIDLWGDADDDERAVSP